MNEHGEYYSLTIYLEREGKIVLTNLSFLRESIKEDDEGLVESAIMEIIQKAKRKRQLKKKGHRRLGMMRHVYLVIDCSESMSIPDLKPTRMMCTVKVKQIKILDILLQITYLIINWLLLFISAAGNIHR